MPVGNVLRRDFGRRGQPSDANALVTDWGSVSERSHRLIGDPPHSSNLPDMEVWEESAPGVLRLPSGRLVRGRGLRQPLPAGALPQFALYLQEHRRRPSLGRRGGCAGQTGGCPLIRLRPARPSPTSGSAPRSSGSRWPAAGDGAGPAPRWRAWPSWTACQPPTPWGTCASITTRGQWKRPGSGGSLRDSNDDVLLCRRIRLRRLRRDGVAPSSARKSNA